MTTMGETFEQWLGFVFVNPVREREWYWDEDFGSRWEAVELTDALVVQYMRPRNVSTGWSRQRCVGAGLHRNDRQAVGTARDRPADQA